MKILLLANKFPYPPKDGGSIATMALVRSFAELGHDVTILAMNTSKHYIDPASIADSLRESSIKIIGIPVDTDIRLFRMARNFLFSRMPYNAERFISREFEDKLKEILQEENFDIIQMEGLYLAPYLKTIRKYSRAKLAMRAHNIEHEIWARAMQHEKGLRKVYMKDLASRIRKMEISYLNSYDAIIPITSRDGEVLKGLGCRLPMHVVPTGVNIKDFKTSIKKMEFPSVFHIGALDWIPNQEGINWFLENVWGKVLEQFPKVKFYLAGRNAPGHYKNLPYKNVVFLGEVEDAYKLMRSKAVMIVPVLSGSGMRIKIIEGMATGKAIVTTTIGTEGISTRHGENILIVDEPEHFAYEICKLLFNRDYYNMIGENARNFIAKEYDNKTITLSLADFYQKLIK
jgi:glycosyltransferase involved in cell wall biosynthesis